MKFVIKDKPRHEDQETKVRLRYGMEGDVILQVGDDHGWYSVLALEPDNEIFLYDTVPKGLGLKVDEQGHACISHVV